MPKRIQPTQTTKQADTQREQALATRPTPACPLPPSEDGFAHSARRRWIRRAMILCAVAAILLAAAAPLLALFDVKTITVTGNQHYTAEVLIEALPTRTGEDVLGVSEREIREVLLAAFPYLSSVEVDKTLGGRLTVLVTERQAAWALELPDGQIVLVDKDWYVLELGLADFMTQHCVICLPAPAEDAEQTPEPTLGKRYRGEDRAIELLADLSAALESNPPASPVTQIDLSSPYMVELRTGDGTVYALQASEHPAERIRAAIRALEEYRAATGQTGAFRVDVDAAGQVIVHPLAEK